MTEHPRPTGATASEHGVLGVRGVDFRLDRAPVAADLAGLVERHWLVSWDLPPGRRASVTLLSHPCVNLVHDRGLMAIAGIGTERFTYELAGSGRVFGVKFRPGGFRPLYGGDVAELTGAVVPLATLWGPAAARLAADLDAAPDLDALVAVAQRYLLAHWPPPDPVVDELGAIVRALLQDRTITRVEEVATRFGIPPRRLQRLFRRCVGVSPKWVLSRYRLHEAAARLAEGVGVGWAEVAAELGYFDQSHFIRDFASAVGMTPAAYAEACRRQVAPVSVPVLAHRLEHSSDVRPTSV